MKKKGKGKENGEGEGGIAFPSSPCRKRVKIKTLLNSFPTLIDTSFEEEGEEERKGGVGNEERKGGGEVEVVVREK